MRKVARWASAEEVASILGISRSQVNRQAASGELPVAVKAPGIRGAYLFDRAAIQRIAKKRAA